MPRVGDDADGEARAYLTSLDADLALECEAVRTRQALAEQARLLVAATVERLVGDMAALALRQIDAEHHAAVASVAPEPAVAPAAAPSVVASSRFAPTNGNWTAALASAEVVVTAHGQRMLAFGFDDPLGTDHGERSAEHGAAPVGAWTDIPVLFAAGPGVAAPEQPALPLAVTRPRPSPHQAVRLIDATPLRISATDGRLVVDTADDPDGSVAGVDLAAVQDRLRGLHRSQQRELAAVSAFLAKHGPAALHTPEIDASGVWLDLAIRRWRDTPVMRRAITAQADLAATPDEPVTSEPRPADQAEAGEVEAAGSGSAGRNFNVARPHRGGAFVRTARAGACTAQPRGDRGHGAGRARTARGRHT